MDLQEIDKERKLQGFSWASLAEGLPIGGDSLRIAFKRGSVDPIYIEHIANKLNLTEANKSNITKNQSVSIPEISNNGVPYYDVDFVGGFDLVFNEQSINPSFYINYAPYNQCDAWINVTGKSMSPFISHGDLVAIKKLNTWQEFIPFGEVYAIITDEFRTIKIVTAGSDSEKFKLIPYNKSPEFVNQEISKNIINNMYSVKGSIKKFF